MERYAAALEFEHCHNLRLALDISQNLHCYEWVPCAGLWDFSRQKLLEAGYVLTADESAYIARNNLEFIRDWSAPEEAGPSMEQQ